MRWVRIVLIVVMARCLAGPLARADDAALAPFVNEQTIVVVRFDVKTVDPTAALQFCAKLLNDHGDDPQRVAAVQNVWQQRTDNAQKLIKGLQKAGASRLYWVLSNSDLANDLAVSAITGTRKGVWIVPAEAGADRAAIAQLITKEPNDNGKPILQSQEIAGAVVAAKPDRRIEHDGAELSADWVKALASNESIVAASVPGETIRRSLEENLPMIQTPIGSLPIKQFTRGVRWITVAIDAQSFAATGAIECTDAATASLMADSITGMVQPLKGKPMRMLAYPFSPIVNAPELFACKAEGTQVRFVPDLNTTIIPLVVKQMRDSLSIKAEGNMRQLLLGSIMYINQHREFPPSLEEMMKEQEMSPGVLIDPVYPAEKQGWVYVKPPGMKTDPKMPVLYEKADSGVLVGFADGHVETLEDRAAVMKLFADAKKPAN